MTHHHHVTFTSTPYDGTTARIVCTAPPGAACRRYCTAHQDCWEYGWEPDKADPCVWADLGGCNPLDYIDSAVAGDHGQAYDGPQRPVTPGPVVLWWDGEGYLWTYPGDVARSERAVKAGEGS